MKEKNNSFFHYHIGAKILKIRVGKKKYIIRCSIKGSLVIIEDLYIACYQDIITFDSLGFFNKLEDELNIFFDVSTTTVLIQYDKIYLIVFDFTANKSGKPIITSLRALEISHKTVLEVTLSKKNLTKPWK